MSGQIKLEKDLFYEIRAVACFLCNYEFNDGDQPWPLFEKRFDEQGNISNGLCEVLSAMLDTIIVETETHSSVLCDKCHASLLEYEHLENKLREIRNEIKSNYRQTMQCILNQNELAPAPEILKTEFSPQVTALYAPKPVDNTVALSDTDAGIADNNFADLIQEVKVEESELLIDAMPAISNSQTMNLEYGAQQSMGSGEHASQHDLDEHMLNSHANRGEYKCSACDCRFFNNASLRQHERSHQKFSSKNFLDKQNNTHTGDPLFKCTECGKAFSTKYRLQAHMKIHTERERPYECDECDKTFLTQQNLKQHKQIHSGMKPIKCNVCAKSFSTPNNLSLHMIVHTNVKPFVCKTCGKSFARHVEVKDHERIHSGERPFKCDLCPMAFAQRSNLNSHKKSTHLNEKLHSCQECNKSFKRRRLLDYHMQVVHTGERPHKCDVCDATFVYPGHYKKHMLIHSGDKPYACEICGKQFNSRDNRNAHRFVHSDKKPYECMECGAGFMRKPLLLAHMQQTKHDSDKITVNQPQFNGPAQHTTTNAEN